MRDFRKNRAPSALVFLLALLGIGFPVLGDTETPALPEPAKKKVDFKQDIEPIFAQKCLACHGSAQQMSGLRLDRRKDALAGGYSGPVILPGKSAESRLIRLVAGLEEGLVMPMGGERLTSQEVGLLRAWIDQGAIWQGAIRQGAVLSQPADSPVKKKAQPKRHPHWAFNSPRRTPLPRVKNHAWVRNPIDPFVLARLEAEGIAPSPEADRRTLLRRVSLDLIGLPPTIEETEQFLANSSPEAYERVVDRLLASPHYGEKWARHWLDLARYADSDGYEKDLPRPYAWRWRHWVIDALNRNMPFDRFTLEQIAGDQLPNATREQKVATGFFRNTLTNREAGTNREEFRVEQVMERTEMLGTVWLGLTVGCTRCHDHKFDPLKQKEFYQFFAFFNTAKEEDIYAPLPGEMGPYLETKAEYDQKEKALLDENNVPALQAEWEKGLLRAAENPGADLKWDFAFTEIRVGIDRAEELLRTPVVQRSEIRRKKLARYFLRVYKIVVGDEKYELLKFKELSQKLGELDAAHPSLSQAQTLAVHPRPRKSHLLLRGDYQQPGIEVQPDTPAVLHEFSLGSEPPRVALARWLVSRQNPLTARVTVNRMWQEYFGKGIVETSEDFGTRGRPPTHPKLLDWLAVEFMERGWDLKRIHRLIVTSATYRQSSKSREDLRERDPGNDLLARQMRLRLSAELIRDVTLSASGLLNPRVGGKSIHPVLPPGVFNLGYGGRRWETSKGPDRYRRGLYIFFRRTTPYPQLMTFDAPDSLLACSRRQRSSTPLQALNLLNDSVFMEAARSLAVRVLSEKPGSVDDRLEYAFRLCLARPPSKTEKERLVRYYREQKKILTEDPEAVGKRFPIETIEGLDPEEAAAWVGLGRVLLNLDEFITRG